MKIEKNIQLAQYTTFKIGGPARFFCSATTESELIEALGFAKKENLPVFILGGGSNILITDKGFSGLVIRIALKGITYDGEVVVAAAGEQWDDLVEQVVSKGLYGLENLSAIPGTVGATPIQNIGAYGAEVGQTITSVRVFDTIDSKIKTLSNADCQFSYRDSLFKHEKGRYIILSVVFTLSKNGNVNTSYREVRDYLTSHKITEPSLEDIRKAVIDIRWGKLPDWKLWGTAGSFFKNPVISASHYKELAEKYPGIPGFPEATDGVDGTAGSDGARVKVSLGWILDKVCNVKGLCVGNVCTYEKQALVLVAKPGATSEEVVDLAQKLMAQVKEKTGIEIEGEVEWVN